MRDPRGAGVGSELPSRPRSASGRAGSLVCGVRFHQGTRERAGAMLLRSRRRRRPRRRNHAPSRSAAQSAMSSPASSAGGRGDCGSVAQTSAYVAAGVGVAEPPMLPSPFVAADSDFGGGAAGALVRSSLAPCAVRVGGVELVFARWHSRRRRPPPPTRHRPACVVGEVGRQ